jgi:hypothetical protein
VAQAAAPLQIGHVQLLGLRRRREVTLEGAPEHAC